MIEDMKNLHIRDEIRQIMRNGFEYGIPHSSLKYLVNKKCVYESDRPDEIDKHLIKWLKQGQLFVNDNIKPLTYVPLFLKDEGDKTRLIPDFKHEINGVSVNKLVLDKYKTVQYPQTKQLLKFVFGDGKINALGKNDGLSFFRQIPMSERDRTYVGYYHRGITFLDSRMPWGTPRAPRVAHYLSVCLVYISYKYIPLSLQPCILPYVDDRILRAQTKVRLIYVHIIFLIICIRAGSPCKKSKTILCNKRLVALGVGFDLNEIKTVFVPENKKVKYIKAFRSFITKKQTTAKEAQSVAGKCEHVSWLKWPMKVYNRILYNLIPPYESQDQTVQITTKLRYAIVQWINALQIMQPARLDYLVYPPKVYHYTIFSDASDIGYGAFEGSSYIFDEFYLQEVNPTDKNIKDRELYPIANFLNANALKYANCNIMIKCDNKNAVAALINKDIRNSRTHNLVILF